MSGPSVLGAARRSSPSARARVRAGRPGGRERRGEVRHTRGRLGNLDFGATLEVFEHGFVKKKCVVKFWKFMKDNYGM